MISEGNTVDKARKLADSTLKFLDDSKGVISKIEAADAKLQLGEGSRSIASDISKALGFAHQLIPQGKPDERQIQVLQAERNRFMQRLLDLEGTVTSLQKQANTDTNVTDLESLAERELSKAAKTIQDAAAALLAENSRRQIKVLPGELDLEGSIVDAAVGIASATQQLVTAAAYAQQERVKQGLGKKKEGNEYFRDPRWTEGLISAGKSVAEATRELVKFANKAAQGTIDECALLAASKVVSASTIALQQATHTKTATGSKPALAVDAASSDVSKATKILVEAAKKYQELEETQNRSKLAGNTDFFNQQALIATLESRLDQEIRNLGALRRQRYQTQQTSTPLQQNQPQFNNPFLN